jgi:hypothetical protein
MRWIAVLGFALLGAAASAAQAAENCAAKWQAAFQAPIPCEPYTPGAAADGAGFFYETGGAVSDDVKKAVLDIAADAFAASKAKYGEFGTLNAVTFVALKDNHPNYNAASFAIWGEAEVDKRRAGESCPVVLFPALADAGADKARQLIAHELWHCFQFDNLPGQLNGDPLPADALGRQLWFERTEWWVEGSAHYFSNLVYPGANLEAGSQELFDQKARVFDQHGKGAYGASLFFQSLGNYSGPAAVMELLKGLPTAGNANAQRAGLAAYGAIGGDFHNYARELIVTSIMDSSGGPIMVPFKGEERATTLAEGETEIALNVKPFTVVKYVFNLEEGYLYTFPSFAKLGMVDGMKLSYLVDGKWIEALADIKIDTRCKGSSAAPIAMLFTRTDDSDGETAAGQAAATLTMSAHKGDCPCDALEAIPVCYVGNWLLDNNAAGVAMSKSNDKMDLQSLDGTIRVNIGADGRTTLKLNGWGPKWTKKSKFENDDTVPKSMTITLNGEFEGLIGKAKSGKMCVIPLADRTTLAYEAMISYWGVADEMPYALTNPMGDPLAGQEADINCAGDEIFYAIPLPGNTGEGASSGRLTREP